MLDVVVGQGQSPYSCRWETGQFQGIVEVKKGFLFYFLLLTTLGMPSGGY